MFEVEKRKISEVLKIHTNNKQHTIYFDAGTVNDQLLSVSNMTQCVEKAIQRYCMVCG